MPLTLNQFLLLVLTLAGVIAVTFLVILFTQLRRTAKEGEKALHQIRGLIDNLNEATTKVQSKLDDTDAVLKATKKMVEAIAQATQAVSTKMLFPASKYWPLALPVLKFTWRHMKKRKKKKD